MTLAKCRLKRISVCRCGYSVLDESIHLETVYTVDLDSIRIMRYHCGRCGQDTSVQAVLASQQLHPGRAMAYLPAGLFDLKSQTVQNANERKSQPVETSQKSANNKKIEEESR